MSSIQKKIILAESIFTGFNPIRNTNSLECKELKSMPPRTAEALDSNEINELKSKNNSN